MKKICCLFILISVSIGFVQAQGVSISILQQGIGFSDSSYYDILKIDSENYWLVGKYGIISNYNVSGKISPVNYPSNALDIYKIARLDENNFIACADKGNLYFYNTLSKTWRSKQVKGYENSCFYKIAVIDKKTALICGGRSAIAHSKKAVPNGFIIKTTDGGETWTKVFSSPFKMVWSVGYNAASKQVSALVYVPNHTLHYTSNDNGDTWLREEKIGKGIYYDLAFDSSSRMICYGGRINGKGKLIDFNSAQTKFKKSGLIWSKVESEKIKIMTACDGNILFSFNSENWEMVHTELADNFSLYKAEFVSPTQVLVVGSGRTILLLSLTDEITSK